MGPPIKITAHISFFQIARYFPCTETSSVGFLLHAKFPNPSRRRTVDPKQWVSTSSGIDLSWSFHVCALTRRAHQARSPGALTIFEYMSFSCSFHRYPRGHYNLGQPAAALANAPFPGAQLLLGDLPPTPAMPNIHPNMNAALAANVGTIGGTLLHQI